MYGLIALLATPNHGASSCSHMGISSLRSGFRARQNSAAWRGSQHSANTTTTTISILTAPARLADCRLRSLDLVPWYFAPPKFHAGDQDFDVVAHVRTRAHDVNNRGVANQVENDRQTKGTYDHQSFYGAQVEGLVPCGNRPGSHR